MATIETNDFWTREILEPVGALAAKIRAQVPVGKVRDVEKDLDLYAGFYLTKAELVDREKISPANNVFLNSDADYRAGKLYLVTGSCVTYAPTYASMAKRFVARCFGKNVDLTMKPSILEREFFINEELFEKLHIPTPSKNSPVGNGKILLCTLSYDFENLSKNWGSLRSRIKTVVS